mgnify:CR=1 FL=1
MILSVLLLLMGYGMYRLVMFYYAPHRSTQQIYLVPGDAVFILHSNNPVSDILGDRLHVGRQHIIAAVDQRHGPRCRGQSQGGQIGRAHV